MKSWLSNLAMSRAACAAFATLLLAGACARSTVEAGAAPATVARQTPPVAETTAQVAAAENGHATVEFTPEHFLANIALLASDKLEGRGTATHGGDLAAGYIAGKFAAAGLLPGGDDGTYFQSFSANLGTDLTDEGTFVVRGLSVAPQRGTDYIPFVFSSNDAFAGEVVFVGYGQVNPDKNYDDYRDVDVKGKVVLMLRKEPPGWGEDGQPSRRATFNDKIYEAKERGAVAVLIANQREEGNGEDRLARFGSLGGGGVFGLPAFHVTRALADKLLAAGGRPNLDALQTKLDETGESCSATLAGMEIEGQAGITIKKGQTQNVVGILPGRGDKTDEYLVIGAHYDHLGKTVAGSMQPARPGAAEETELIIHNGADDNASGVSGILELAQALARAPHLRRSVVFIAFSGEELGLLGSKHFVEHPTVPLEQVVAMVNLDMIGRLKEKVEKIPVFGAKSAPELEAVVSSAGAAQGFGSEGLGGAMSRSDHASFDRKGIPNLFFFTGTHADYHRPTDDTDKINAEGGVRIVQMIYDIAVQVANADARPQYHKVEGPAEGERPMARSSARMGITPGYAEEEDQPGMLVDDVQTDGPAATAGIRQGDRITQIQGKPVKNVYDYMAALGGRKPGDEVEVVLRRGDQDVTLTVKLGGRTGGR